jgi:hypothetical protein
MNRPAQAVFGDHLNPDNWTDRSINDQTLMKGFLLKMLLRILIATFAQFFATITKIDPDFLVE